MSFAILVAVAIGLFPVAAHAVRRPIQIRIEGYVDAAPKGVRTSRTVGVQIGKGKQRDLAVSELRNLSQGALGATILENAARYKPSFRLVGDDPALRPLEDAPSGTFFKITGNLSANRYLLVSHVELGK